MIWESLPTRTLDQYELQRLVDDLASHPRVWTDLISFSDGLRHFELLHRNAHLDVWLICWTAGNTTGWHDHDTSCGAVRVLSGTIRESSLRIWAEPREQLVKSGGSFCFGADHIHSITGVEDEAVSVHAYSPPLWRLGQYSISRDGTMRRISVSYTDELRPPNQLQAPPRDAVQVVAAGDPNCLSVS